jgi:2',3'-cyclic-nucleotide 2'-phosphodiesterase/3'-nucleotidase
LKWQGRPLADDQPLRLAVNNFRAGGSGGYTMFRDAKVVWKSGDEIRDIMIRYYSDHKTLPTKPQDNWRIVPTDALPELQRESDAAATAPPINK